MPGSSSPPNIVLILTDHFRPDALSKATPTLMGLAQRGATFTNAYCASPLCQPSRLSIATGLYPSQHGACGNMSEPIPSGLRDDTFMHHLRRVGYNTALIGKHHYIDRYGIGMDVTDDDDQIRRYGFDHVCQVVDAGENMHNDCRYTHFLRERGRLDEYRRVQEANGWACREYPFPEEDCEDGFIGREACEHVARVSTEQPFYLNVSFIGPHPPYWHPGEPGVAPEAVPPPVGAPDSPRVRERRRHYLEKCAVIDRAVARLLDTLEAHGILDNTIVIFTSDHGDNLGDYGIWDKRFFFEQSAGVPLVMAGPGVPRGARGLTGRKSRALVSHLDLYPTILRLAGSEPPERTRPGRDLLAVLRNEPSAFRDAVFSQLGTGVMIRTANWKLVFDAEQDGVQYLYNLATDPGEATNLAGHSAYGEVASRLLEQLVKQYIRLSQFTHDKEEQRVQRVRVARTPQ